MSASELARMRDEIATLRRALVRLAWTLVADEVKCICYAADRCPACETYAALGYGSKWGLWGAKARLSKEARRS